MIGKPKYRRNQKVWFTVDQKTVKGKISFIDKFGTFDQSDEVSYDIFSVENDTLYKHIPESWLTHSK